MHLDIFAWAKWIAIAVAAMSIIHAMGSPAVMEPMLEIVKLYTGAALVGAAIWLTWLVIRELRRPQPDRLPAQSALIHLLAAVALATFGWFVFRQADPPHIADGAYGGEYY